jgi:hypothetical protein
MILFAPYRDWNDDEPPPEPTWEGFIALLLFLAVVVYLYRHGY